LKNLKKQDYCRGGIEMFDIGNVLEPKTLDEAVEMYNSNPNLKIIAGGTDVLIKMRHGELEGAELLSLRNIKGMDEIKLLEDQSISIGAMTSFSQLFRSEIINKYLYVLSEAAVSMGGPQVRNMATVGGNISNGAVSADSAPTLFALNALLKLKSVKGERIVPITEFYEGPGRVKLQIGEILESIIITKENYNQLNGNYIKYCNRKAMDIAMLSVSVVCKVEAGKFSDMRIALGVAAPTPIRCSEAESYALNKQVTEETINEIGKYALKASKARDSWRGSKAYREHLVEVLVQRAIKEAIKRAGGNGNE
jgi:xanthine dehydrogenase FAD-binding subunit